MPYPYVEWPVGLVSIMFGNVGMKIYDALQFREQFARLIDQVRSECMLGSQNKYLLYGFLTSWGVGLLQFAKLTDMINSIKTSKSWH